MSDYKLIPTVEYTIVELEDENKHLMSLVDLYREKTQKWINKCKELSEENRRLHGEVSELKAKLGGTTG